LTFTAAFQQVTVTATVWISHFLYVVFVTAARISRKACFLSFLCFLHLSGACFWHRRVLSIESNWVFQGLDEKLCAQQQHARTHGKKHGMARSGGDLIGRLDATQLHQTTFFVFWNSRSRFDWVLLGLLLVSWLPLQPAFFLSRSQTSLSVLPFVG